MLLETIKCKDGELHNLGFHQSRFDAARARHFPEASKLNLVERVQVPQEFREGLYRCRVLYSEEIDKIEFHPHQIRKVHSLRLVEDNAIAYPYKYSDRSGLDDLFEKRASCDDVLIVKKGCITDSYYANAVFFDGRQWWTSDTPLLPGTQRARLLAEGKVSACRITVNDLSKYEKVGLVNALQDMDDMPVVPIGSIQGTEGIIRSGRQ